MVVQIINYVNLDTYWSSSKTWHVGIYDYYLLRISELDRSITQMILKALKLHNFTVMDERIFTPKIDARQLVILLISVISEAEKIKEADITLRVRSGRSFIRPWLRDWTTQLSFSDCQLLVVPVRFKSAKLGDTSSSQYGVRWCILMTSLRQLTEKESRLWSCLMAVFGVSACRPISSRSQIRLSWSFARTLFYLWLCSFIHISSPVYL